MRRLVLSAILIAAAGLSACKPETPRPTASGQSALDIMEKVAVSANNCWFKSGDAAFRAYQLSPELSSFSGRPRILLVRKGSRDDRPVLVVQAEGKPPRLDAFGPLLNEDVAPRIRQDVVRWANGRKDC
ncbi:hypothetical protein HNR26_003150 [Rhizobium rosettiformans]|jgi:hypothetical protein|uniref:Lipoprotein n=2 Tax=Rhizobium rosettiformans TaxID=1368430 RepID=A0A4S8PTW0_9HYPH|nr:hypothetical protein [Rhizobium rosettiformans]MBA4798756.1 hypothetical protein [Hyphomicrobiales bacterium]MBB5277072.1 hypothetical protein [Rhizobium rosettiformans]THV34873.1 hypothetical protein FAA86_14450 [Rhizobium rosettiformans W3]